MALGPQASRHLGLDRRRPGLPQSDNFGETDIQVPCEAEDGLLVLDAPLVPDVRVGLCDRSPFAFCAGRKFVPFSTALGQGRAVPLAHGPPPRLGQGLGPDSFQLVASIG